LMSMFYCQYKMYESLMCFHHMKEGRLAK